MYQVKVQCRFSSILRAQLGWPCMSGKTVKLAWLVCTEVTRCLDQVSHCALIGVCCFSALSKRCCSTRRCVTEAGLCLCMPGKQGQTHHRHWCTRGSANSTCMQLVNHQMYTHELCQSQKQSRLARLSMLSSQADTWVLDCVQVQRERVAWMMQLGLGVPVVPA